MPSTGLIPYEHALRSLGADKTWAAPTVHDNARELQRGLRRPVSRLTIDSLISSGQTLAIVVSGDIRLLSLQPLQNVGGRELVCGAQPI
jgi:hypothetical protein